MYKILIVEDEELERTSMKIFLEENLLDVEIVGEAKSGFEAVEMIDSKDINLLLVDINIPGIDGMEVIKYARKKLPKAVIIITTAYDDFRKEVLLESVKSFSSRLGEGRQTGKSNKLLSKFEMELKKCSYKASVDILRDYIDQLYLEEHDVNIISKRLQEVAKTIVRISEELGIVDTNELVVQMEKLKIKYLLYNNKHDAYNEIIKMVDILFDKMNIKGKLSEGGMKAVIDYIERNLKKGISLEDVANHVNISTYYLSKIFKKEMGVNFITYVTDRKMDLAKEMLVNTDIPVLNIALDLAYNEANYFSKAFKKKTGLTPSEYREKYRNRKEEENETV